MSEPKLSQLAGNRETERKPAGLAWHCSSSCCNNTCVLNWVWGFPGGSASWPNPPFVLPHHMRLGRLANFGWLKF